MKNKVFIIAEAGVNHNGSRELALELVDIAADAGVDAIKFQTFTADKLVRKGAEKAEYQKQNTDSGDQYSMLKNLEMSAELHHALIQRCAEKNIEFMSTAFDNESLDFLISLGIKRIKIPSGEITNFPFIRHIASKNLPIILSTGMATLDEIQEAKQLIEVERSSNGLLEPIEKILTILHCTSNYPADPENVNLLAMNTIAKSTQVPIGYSDHTLGLAVSTAAVAMGASIIEKHFTKSRDLDGPDHNASLTPDELTQMMDQIRTVEVALGSSVKQPTQSEMPVRELVRRSVTAKRDIAKGQVITEEDLTLMRPGDGILPKNINLVIGRVARNDIASNSTIKSEHLGDA